LISQRFDEKNIFVIPGFHGVHEALIQGQPRIMELWLSEGKKPERVRKILALAGDQGVPVSFKKGTVFSHLLPDTAHQGIVALVEEFHYSDLEQVIKVSLKNDDRAILLVLDHITDEGNLGALIRTAAFFGVHGLIIPKDRSAGVTVAVLKRASGAWLHIPVVRVVNLGRTLDLLEKRGFWIIGASGETTDSIFQFDWNRNLALVLGNEQKGLSRSVKQCCHQEVSIPAQGNVESLNVGVAGGVILSEIIRHRNIV